MKIDFSAYVYFLIHQIQKKKVLTGYKGNSIYYVESDGISECSQPCGVDVNVKSMSGAELLRSWPDDLGYSITPDLNTHSPDSPYYRFCLLLLVLPSFPSIHTIRVLSQWRPLSSSRLL